MLLVEGGDEIADLFKYIGKVLPGDTYAAAVEKVKVALKKRGNRTSAVFKLFNTHHQGSQSFRLVEQGGEEGGRAHRLDRL